MWLMTAFGFFSIIQRKPDDTLLTIRGSARSDLEALRGRYLPSLGDIEEDSETDHKFRARASREAVAQALSRIAMEIDYASFTEKTKELHGSRAARIQGGLWEVLWELRNGQSDNAGERECGNTEHRDIRKTAAERERENTDH